MGVEKDGSRNGGGYVGGFFQLFDWTSKSRKKLFSSKSDLPEHSKQGKRIDGNLPTTRFHYMDDNENGAASSIKGSSDYSCASSITDEDGYGAKAPGVVARLMGLDSLPTSNISDLYSSTPFSDTQSLREISRRKNFDYQDHRIMSSGNLSNKVETSCRYFADPKPQKMLNRPFEKFQTEVLPPKSAKSIPITHHKLLSPIKNPGFVSTKNAAHIMEAAARILESSPQTNNPKSKFPLVGSSSAPLKLWDLKEKTDTREKVEASRKISRSVEAFQRPLESNAAKYLKGQNLNKSWNGSVDSSYNESPDRGQISYSYASKNKGKSISLAVQAKVNVQRREGLNASGNQSSTSLKGNEVKSGITFRSQQQSTQKNLHKKSNMSGVLRQNNQKQNCLAVKDRASTSNSSSKKTLPGNSSRSLNRSVGSKGEKRVTHSTQKNNPRKKRSIDRELSSSVDSVIIEKDQKVIKSSPIFEKQFSWDEESRAKGMDVVSFTFTTPLTRSNSSTPQRSGQLGKKSDGVLIENRGKRLFTDEDGISSVGYNAIGGDQLSKLLEQKLRDLTLLETKSAASSTSRLPDTVPTPNTGNTIQRPRKNQYAYSGDQLSNCYDSKLFSNNDSVYISNNMFKGGGDGANKVDVKKDDYGKLFEFRHPSPISILEPSFSTESCFSTECTNSNSSEGSKPCSSVQAVEVLGLNSSNKFHCIDADTELLDSASSISTGKYMDHSTTVHLDRTNKEEQEYVKEILHNIEIMFDEFSLGRSQEIINPQLFDQLIRSRTRSSSYVEQKLVFDCISELLDIKCRGYGNGGCKSYLKGVTMVKQRERLAEEVLKEISGCKHLWNCMVDELVDKDMSNQHGRWLDFEVEEFVIGVEVEDQIVNSLIDEMLADILLV